MHVALQLPAPVLASSSQPGLEDPSRWQSIYRCSSTNYHRYLVMRDGRQIRLKTPGIEAYLSLDAILQCITCTRKTGSIYLSYVGEGSSFGFRTCNLDRVSDYIVSPSCSLASFLIDRCSREASPGRAVLNQSQRPIELLRTCISWIPTLSGCRACIHSLGLHDCPPINSSSKT